MTPLAIHPSSCRVVYSLDLLMLIHLLNHLDGRTLAALFPLIQAE